MNLCTFLQGDDLEMILHDDSSSSDEDDLDLLLLNTTATGFLDRSREYESRLHLDDLSAIQCEEMFR